MLVRLISLLCLWPTLTLAAPSASVAIKDACQHAAKCGCPDPSCVTELTAAGAPAAVYACLAKIPCNITCSPGEEAAAAFEGCLAAGFGGGDEALGMGDEALPDAPAAAPVAVPPVPAAPAPAAVPGPAAPLAPGQAGAIQAACAKSQACGCGKPTCVEEFTQAGGSLSTTVFTCFAGLDCQAVCDPQAGSPGHVAFDTCLAPEQNRVMRQNAQASELQRKRHQMMMGIINNMGATPKQRVDIYDQNNQYIRTEER